MNKVARLLSSTVLAAGLAMGTSVTAFADNNNYDRSHGTARYDNNYDRDRDHGRYDRDRDRDHRYIYICFDRRGNHWVVKSDRYEHRWNCYVIRVRR